LKCLIQQRGLYNNPEQYENKRGEEALQQQQQQQQQQEDHLKIGRGDGNIICDCNNLPVSNDQSKPLSQRQTERFSPKDKNVNMRRE